MNADGEPPDRARGSRDPTELVVRPTRIGDGRRASLPAFAAAIGLAAFVAVAFWKPWDTGLRGRASSPRPPGASASAASGDVAAGSAAPIATERVLRVDGTPFPSNAQMLAATTRQPTWGVRAIVIRTGGPIFTGQPNLVERWAGVPSIVGDRSPSLSALAIAQPDDDVAAIGVTTLDDALPLDVRFWSLPPNGPPQRLAAIPTPGPEAGSWLWLADPAHATDRGTWRAGTYEIEVLLGPSIVRLVVTIPSASVTSIRVPTPFGQPPFATILDRFEPGPFALADGGAQALVGGSPPVADERQAWLGPAAGLPLVAEVAGRQVTGFGMLFAAGQEPVGVEVRQLGQRRSPIETALNVVAVEPGGRQAIIAFPVTGGVFPDGVYRVTVNWTSGGADRSASWAVEVLPAIQQRPPLSPLDAMSRWVGLLDHPRNGARQPLVFIPDAAGGSDSCSPSTIITGSDPYLGIVVPARVLLTRMRMLPLDVNRSADIAIRLAPDAIPRLTVVALPNGGLPVRDYDVFLTLVSAAGESTIAQRICVSGP